MKLYLLNKWISLKIEFPDDKLTRKIYIMSTTKPIVTFKGGGHVLNQAATSKGGHVPKKVASSKGGHVPKP